jgi:hypothetical protein
MAPAPAAANAMCEKDIGEDVDWPAVHRMNVCNLLYERNRHAFSAMAPTIGAGKP